MPHIPTPDDLKDAAGDVLGAGKKVVGAIVNPVKGTAELAIEVGRVIKFLESPGAWVRIAKVVIGSALIIGGVYSVARVQLLAPVGEKVAAGAATATKGLG